jgi:GT2 family glycosyltransferase
VSVVICSRDRPALLAVCLTALRPVLGPEDNVVVVDSASRTDETAMTASAHGFPLVRLTEPGLARARNAGLGETESAIVAFTDDDCLPQPGWLDATAAAFDSNTGVVMGRVLPAHGDASAPADDPGDDPFEFFATSRVDELGAGANMAFRRSALELIGGFDERLGAGTRLRSGEDHDAMWRVLRAGWTGRYEPAARVVHSDWRSPWTWARMRYGYGLGAGANAVKMIRVDPHVGWTELRHRAWDKGARQTASHLRLGWERPAAGDLLYSAGVLIGAGIAWRLPLDRGHLRAR